MKNKWRGGKKYEAKGDSSKESTIISYECKKSGHIKVEPKEVTNICLMAHEEENEVST